MIIITSSIIKSTSKRISKKKPDSENYRALLKRVSCVYQTRFKLHEANRVFAANATDFNPHSLNKSGVSCKKGLLFYSYQI
jgi:hypothetical protein